MRAVVSLGADWSLACCQVAAPAPDAVQVLIRVRACAVCRTDLHVVDGDLPHPTQPVLGFGAAAYIIAQVAHHQGREVDAFTRPGDVQAQALARGLGAVWAEGIGRGGAQTA